MFPCDTAVLARFMPRISDERMRGIWVYEKTLTVTNGHMLMRRFCDIPDGFYRVGNAQYLEPIEWIGNYPQIEQFKGRYLSKPKENVCGELLGRDVRGKMLEVCHEAMDNSVTLAPSGIWVTYDSATRFDFPFMLPFPIEVNPDYLILALTEMARYDGIHLIKDGNPLTPLVLGLNWGSCVMIMPLRGKNNG